MPELAQEIELVSRILHIPKVDWVRNVLAHEVKKELEAMRPQLERELESHETQTENATQLLNGSDGALSMFPYIQQSLAE